jgi:hypothetical protein
VGKASAVALLVLSLQPLPAHAPFAATLPAGLPSLRGFERITGDVELQSPRLRVEYEFYVNPRRPGVYELVRYRVTLPPGSPDALDYPRVEKLQWHATTNVMRRFECDPAADPASPCRWRELAQGSREYHREVPVILWLYGLHLRGDQARVPAPATS